MVRDGKKADVLRVSVMRKMEERKTGRRQDAQDLHK